MSIEAALESSEFKQIKKLFTEGVCPSSLFEPSDIHYSIGQNFRVSTLEVAFQNDSTVIHTEASKKEIHNKISALAQEHNVEDTDALWKGLSGGGLNSEDNGAAYNKEKLDHLVNTSETKINEKRCAAVEYALSFNSVPKNYVSSVLALTGVLGFREKIVNRESNDPSTEFSKSTTMHDVLSGIQDGKWNFLNHAGASEELLAEYGVETSKYKYMKDPAEVMNAGLDSFAALTRVTDKEMLWSTLCKVYGGENHNLPAFDEYVDESVANFDTRYNHKKLHGSDHGNFFAGDFGFIAKKVDECLKNGRPLSNLAGSIPDPNPHFEESSKKHWEDIVKLKIVASVVTRMTHAGFRGQYGAGHRPDASNLSVSSAGRILKLLTPDTVIEKCADIKNLSIEHEDKTYKGTKAGFLQMSFGVASGEELNELIGKCYTKYNDEEWIASHIRNELHHMHHEVDAYSPEDQLMYGMRSFEEAHEYLYIKFVQQKQRYDNHYAQQRAASNASASPEGHG